MAVDTVDTIGEWSGQLVSVAEAPGAVLRIGSLLYSEPFWITGHQPQKPISVPEKN